MANKPKSTPNEELQLTWTYKEKYEQLLAIDEEVAENYKKKALAEKEKKEQERKNRLISKLRLNQLTSQEANRLADILESDNIEERLKEGALEIEAENVREWMENIWEFRRG